MYASQNKLTYGLIAVAVIALILFGLTYSNKKDSKTANEDQITENMIKNPIVTFKTNMGDISLELYLDKTPITAGNFLKLSKDGFYTGTKFHRVIDDFMIQGGDPNTKGDDVSTYGQGGPGYYIEDEFNPELSNVRGTISMANIGEPNTGGSQFFINYASNVGLDFDKNPLTSKHPVFGIVVEGMDIVDNIIKVETGANNLPITPIVIEEVIVNEGGIGEGMIETEVNGKNNEPTDETEELEV